MTDIELIARAKEALSIANKIIIGVQATGGYKYRQLVKGTDKELDEFVQKALRDFRNWCVGLTVAEAMLQEPDYWRGNTRWEEYRKRVTGVTVAIIRDQAEARSKAQAARAKTESASA